MHPKLRPNRETRCIFTGYDPAKSPQTDQTRRADERLALGEVGSGHCISMSA
jgi:hypothetical protein